MSETVSSISEWLNALQMGDLVNLFRTNGFQQLADLEDLDEHSLVNMGVVRKDIREKLIKYAPSGAKGISPVAVRVVPTAEQLLFAPVSATSAPQRPAPPSDAPPTRPNRANKQQAEAPASPKPSVSASSPSPVAPPVVELDPNRPVAPPRRRTSVKASSAGVVSSSAQNADSPSVTVYENVTVDRLGNISEIHEEMESDVSSTADLNSTGPQRVSSIRSDVSSVIDESLSPTKSYIDDGSFGTSQGEDTAPEEEDEEEGDGRYVPLPRPASIFGLQGALSEEFMKSPQYQQQQEQQQMRQHARLDQLEKDNLLDRRESTLLSSDSKESLELLAAKAASDTRPRKVNVKPTDVTLRRKTGWLYKRGGITGRKGWDKRWVVYEAGTFSYYARPEDEQPNGTIALREMKSVRPPSSMKVDGKHPYRFELETYERTFYFSTDTAQEMTEWMTFLGATIQAYKPTAADSQVGGSMCSPDKEGWLKKQSNNEFRTVWNRRYVAIKEGTLCYYNKYDDFKLDNPVATINTLLVTVKVGQGGNKAKNHQFQLVTQQRNLEFQADSKEEMMSWITAIQNSILWSLNQMQSESTRDVIKKQEKISPEKALQTIRENEHNLVCADCGTANPDWASINLGTVFCIECSGVHRSLGVHISKVRSMTLDEWTPSLLSLIKNIGSAKSNTFWEGNLTAEKPAPGCDKTVRENYIREKYEKRAFIEYHIEPEEPLDKQLFENVVTDNLLNTIELVVAGVDKTALDPVTGWSALKTAEEADQNLQVELLTQLGFKWTQAEDEERKLSEVVAKKTEVDPAQLAPPSYHTGYLFKRGARNVEWQKRWFVYDHGVLSYYRSNVDAEPAGSIAIESMVKVEEAREESRRDPRYRYCFQLDTVGARNYMLCAENMDTMREWMRVLQMNIDALPPSARGFDFKTCSKVGYLEKRGEHNTMYKRRYFALKGKGLYYFKEKDDQEEAGMIDLRTITDIVEGVIADNTSQRGTPVKRAVKPETSAPVMPTTGLPEEFCLLAPGRSYQLKASSREEASEWMSVLRNTQVFGVPLSSSSSLVPLIVEKCCDFVENNGIFTEGIYRVPGNSAVIKQIRQAFNMDDDAVQLTVDKYSVHDVGGALKLFFRELPDPLIPSNLYQKFIAASAVQDHNSSLYSLQSAIKELPYHNYETLKRMCVHLARISEHSDSNKMTIRNVCIVFGPTLMSVDAQNTGDSQQTAAMNFANMGGEYKCVSDLVTYHEWLFDMEAKSEKDLIIEEGLKKMEQAKLLHAQAASASLNTNTMVSTPFIFEVFYEDTSISHTLPITNKMTGKEVCNLMVAKGEYQPSSDWSIVEVLKGKGLQRAIEDHENVIESTSNWKCHGELRMQPNPSKQLIFEAVRKPMAGWLHIKKNNTSSVLGMAQKLIGDEKWQWKKYWCTCDPNGKSSAVSLYYYKDEHNTAEVGYVDLAGAQVYKCYIPKKGVTDYCFAIRRIQDDFTTWICAENQGEEEQWIACLTVAKDPMLYAKLAEQAETSSS